MKRRCLVSILALALAVAVSACGIYRTGERMGTDPTGTAASPQTASAATQAPTQAPTEAPSETAASLTQTTAAPTQAPTDPLPTDPVLDENGVYDSKDEVALYIRLYGRLPSNYITKKEAEALGWTGGSLEPYAPGKCIGGSRFGNYEGLLPEKKGRTYTECDVDTLGAKSRGAKRIVYSSDGLIYYTDDHYESFTLLYGEE